jgi:predicted Co/Zn/Cd cation transporter (cation efflux family)
MKKKIFSVIIYAALLFAFFYAIGMVKDGESGVVQPFIKTVCTMLVIWGCKKLWNIKKRLN